MNPSNGSSDDKFWLRVISELLRASRSHQTSNIDTIRFEYTPSLYARIKQGIVKAAASRGFYRASPLNLNLLKIEGLRCAYELLEDEQSKDLFVKLLAYRVLGYRHVKLLRNDPQYWELRNSIDRYVKKRDAVKQIAVWGSLDLLQIDGIRFHCHRLAILNTFLLQQYRCTRAGVEVQSRDVVIDGGGCWGDTALYFAQRAKRVYCFECIPANLKILEGNLSLNPELGSRIQVVPKALWNRSGEKFMFEDLGPGSRPASSGKGIQVETESIDEFVSKNSLPRVDFIKMDIEGAEPEALRGAEQTIRKHHPKLAISVYHDPNHFASIPGWLDSLDLGYRLYLDHFTIHSEETVLFATCDPRQNF
jgi:FkbM family methyltransferase